MCHSVKFHTVIRSDDYDIVINISMLAITITMCKKWLYKGGIGLNYLPLVTVLMSLD